MSFFGKKGQIQGGMAAIVAVSISFVILGIVLALSSSILDTVRDTAPNQIASDSNDTLVWAGNNTAMALSQNTVVMGGGYTLYSNGTKVNQGLNYTVLTGSVVITNLSGLAPNTGGWVTSDLNFSYDYYYGSAGRNTSAQSVGAITTISSYQSLIALAIIAAIIIGIIVVYFRFKEE